MSPSVFRIKSSVKLWRPLRMRGIFLRLPHDGWKKDLRGQEGPGRDGYRGKDR